MSHWGELQQKLCHPGQRWNRAAVAFDESGMLAEGSLPDQAPMVRALLHPRTRRAALLRLKAVAVSASCSAALVVRALGGHRCESARTQACDVGGMHSYATRRPWGLTHMEVLMRYETTTTLAPEAALAAAEQFFGGEFGLTIRQRGPQVIGFEGGGGHVLVSVTAERPTTLELETREWDRQVTHFMERLPR